MRQPPEIAQSIYLYLSSNALLQQPLHIDPLVIADVPKSFPKLRKSIMRDHNQLRWCI